MTSCERVIKTIKGEPVDRTPIYGWVFANLKDEISEIYGSIEAFEDHYEFDAAHIFGGPAPFRSWDYLKSVRERYEELKLEAEIRRVFDLMKGKRWICCTTHFVQNHCTMEDLKFAFDLIYKLARE